MLHHYLTLFARSVRRQFGYYGLNFLGLCLGITAVLLVGVSLIDEYGYDRFHDRTERIFRVNKYVTEPSGELRKSAESPGLMGETLVADYPEVERAARYMPWFEEVLLTHGEESLYATGLTYVDTNFLNIFNFRVLQGDPRALAEPGRLFLTPALANGLFGNSDPVGQTVIAVDNQPYTVAGIIEAPPRRSHLRFDALASYASTTAQSGLHDFSFMNNWLGQVAFTYVVLDRPEQAAQVEARLPDFVRRYMPNRTDHYAFYLQPLHEIYLQSHDIPYLRGGKFGNAVFLRTFAIIAALVLLIAVFNYVNASTARSLQRSREVGVKKVLGAGRRQLIRQFLFETLFIVGIAALTALVLSHALLPRLNEWFGREIPLAALRAPIILIGLVGLIAITAVAAGLFPALVLSRFRPVTVLRPGARLAPGGEWPRQVLTALQLTVSMALVAGTLVLHQQFRYLSGRELGFAKDQVLTLNTPPGIDSSHQAFYRQLVDLPGVQSASMAQAAMTSGTFGTTVFPQGQTVEYAVQVFRVDTNFQDTWGLNIVAGRFPATNRTSDQEGVVINETFARQMGWAEPLGKTIRFAADEPPAPVIGVVRDFHYTSLHEAIGPLVMFLDEQRRGNISVRFDPAEVGTLLPRLGELWERFETRYPFEYEFADAYFAESYLGEQTMVRVITLFAGLAIFIACLGLYGLAAFAAARRTREIGVRKVLGASTGSILVLFYRRLLVLCALAFVGGAPLAWLALRRYLDNFAYRLDPQPWHFLLAGLVATLIALLTVSVHSVRAAVANPVRALRSE